MPRCTVVAAGRQTKGHGRCVISIRRRALRYAVGMKTAETERWRVEIAPIGPFGDQPCRRRRLPERSYEEGAMTGPLTFHFTLE